MLHQLPLTLLLCSQVTMNHVAWCVITLNSVKPNDATREREVLSTTKLQPNANGKAKTGANIGGACAAAVQSYKGMPVSNIDYCCTDTTASNSSLNLPQRMGGDGGEGGAYAHLWSSFRSKGHVLFFIIWCLSHLVSNEVGTVMKLAGRCRRTRLLRKRGKRKDGLPMALMTTTSPEE